MLATSFLCCFAIVLRTACAASVQGDMPIVDRQARATDIAVQKQEYREACPSSFTYVPAVNGCYKVVTQNMDWTMAGLRCKTLNVEAHLLIINNAEEQAAVAGMMSAYNDRTLSGCTAYTHGPGVALWTAGQRMTTSQNTPFVWRMAMDVCLRIDAVSEMQYTNWRAGEPNGGARESCMQLCRGWNYAWNDKDCGAAYCFICEIDII